MESVARVRPDVSFVPAPEGTGSVVLLFDCGWAPHKREFKLMFPTYHSLGAIAIPVYERTANPAARARLVIGSRSFVTEILTDVDAVAFKYHKNRLPLLLVKHAIRLALKVAEGEAAAYGVKEALKPKQGTGRQGRQDTTLADAAGWLTGLAVGAVNAALEQADLRAWLSLPQSFQAVRANVPPGEHRARVELLAANGRVLASADAGVVRVARGRVSFVVGRSLGSSLFVARPDVSKR
jgi:hypothetical protein